MVGFEGYYEVSNLGNVRSRDRLVNCFGNKKTVEGRVLISSLRNGYPRVSLAFKGSKTDANIHCLVAAAFLGDRPASSRVYFVDGDKLNCRADNLEYRACKCSKRSPASN